MLSQDFEKRPSVYNMLVRNILLLFLLLSVIIGFLFGSLLRHSGTWTLQEAALLRLPGDIFSRVLHCLSIPLAMTSVTGAAGSWKRGMLVRVGLRTLVYILCTTCVAAVIGLILAMVVRPGGRAKSLPPNPLTDSGEATHIRDVGLNDVLDIVRNIVPGNVMEAFLFMTETSLSTGNEKSHSSIATVIEHKLTSPNILGLVTFSLMVGFSIAYNGDGPENSLIRFSLLMSSKFMHMAEVILKYSPIGIFSLIVSDVLRVKDVSGVVWHLGIFVFTVLLGLGVHAFLFLPTVYMVCVRKNATHFFVNVLYPIFIAFGTTSAVTTSPVTMSILETRIGACPGIVRFVLPFAALFNCDGTALYEVVSVAFIAQLRQADLGFGKWIMVTIAGAFSSLGVHGLHPSLRGLAHMALLLRVADLSPNDVGLVMATHWLLSRFCSAINLLSGCVAVAVLQSTVEEEADFIICGAIEDQYVPTVQVTGTADTSKATAAE
ncbi:neutral amino acid transporter B(0)-like isoform X2 [Ornithodoros turicata]